jgi:DNA-binding response OmpR family regulator
MNAQKTILLIDDEADLRQLVKIALASRGYLVETAGNGIEGLEKLHTVKPDLIILDMNMPKMGGLEFYQKICVNGHPEYPVLVLTARANMEHLFRDLNIDGFMAKPFEVDDLLGEVETIIRGRAGSARPSSGAAAGAPRGAARVCVAENDEAAFSRIGSAFLGAGYIVNAARSGTEAIERISSAVPDAAVIKLGLTDISGDIVVGKLKMMAKTREVKCVLYTDRTADRTIITEQISRKGGIDCFLVSDDPGELVGAVNKLLQV